MATQESDAQEIQQRFTFKQLAKYKRIFNIFDIKKDGVVSVKEMAAMAKKLGYNLDKTKIEAIVNKLDREKKGTLNFLDFLCAMPGNVDEIPSEEHKRAALRIHLREFDKDGTGFIAEDEAREVLDKELAFPAYKLAAYMKFFIKNKDGKININEFSEFYQQVEEKKGELERIFKEFDTNGDGFVDIQEAQVAMRPFDVPDEETERLVLESDKDGDQKLNWTEFVNFWGTD
ncbi:calmodulin [Lingula anatina]|uniref:Calmodulin n=1 Tax=Lingula anatina TaxID=7574 RepID=A0A1S3HMQ7_LINAN|nr:calmodulin [Lingula anatina]XP_013387348.1 calmodulin [Lingula anatina]XP_013387349.1 calmodulin [Lingula anatina]XP_013387350.1 calmodulin [Lingula anatina]XP_013387352.1 calmodulin [Lingula anatina]|eukprot:XP_013387347.1 calmodulin [Lingula anatina]